MGRVDGDAPHMNGVSLAIEAETGEKLVIDQRQGPALAFEIIADRCLRFP